MNVALDRGFRLRCVAALLMGFGGALILGAAWTAAARPGETDFYVFYESARAWRSGTDLYTTARDYPNLNPPHFVVAMVPFTALPLRGALVLWLILNMAAAGRVVVLIWRELGLPRSFAAAGIGAAAAGLTTGLQFGMETAQPTGIFAWVFTAAWLASRRGNQVREGLLIGALISVKPFLVLVLLVPMLKQQWKVIVWAAVAGVLAVVAGLGTAGIGGYLRWIETGRQVSWFVHPLNISVMGTVARLGLGWWAWVCAAIPLIAASIMAIRKTTDVDAAWVVTGLASILLSPLGWVYYLPLISGPLTAMAIGRPLMLAAGVGLLWPVPLLMSSAPHHPLTTIFILSIPSYSLLGVWASAVRESFAVPAPDFAR